HDFFDKQYHDQEVYDSFGPIPTQVAQLAARESGHRNVYVSREFNEHPAFGVLTRGKQINLYTAANIALLRRDEDDLLIIDPKELGMLPTLRRLYPNLDVEDDLDAWGRLQFTKVVIPAADVYALHRVRQSVSMTPRGATGAGAPEISEAF